MICTADFETVNKVDDCRVWAWGIKPLYNDEFYHGTDIDTFMSFLKGNNGEYWFHNLAFDSGFILHWLFTNGFEYSDKEDAKTFKTLISKDGKFYSIDIVFEKKDKKKSSKVTLKDSFKKLPMSIAAIAKAFELEESKLEIDYNAERPIGHVLTDMELDYLKADCLIAAKALAEQFSNERDLTNLTIGSDALKDFKKRIGSKWDTYFPELNLELDSLLRLSYKGGYVYCNPKYQGKRVGKGHVFDVTSLYPYIMHDRNLPIGLPLPFEGKYEEDGEYPLYIQWLTCHAKLKPDHLPTLQIKNNPYYLETQYIEDTEGYVDLVMTNIDLQLLFDHYDVDVLDYSFGFKFQQKRGMFNEYIDYWLHEKETTTGGRRLLAKLMLNSLYGKFATNPDVTPKIPYMDESGIVKFKDGDEEFRKPVYTPVGSFTTAYARDYMIRNAQKNYDRFLYCDTDSYHGLDDGVLPDLDIHPTKLGGWKPESRFSEAKYIRAKTYAEQITHEGAKTEEGWEWNEVETYLDVKCAGLPDFLKHHVTMDNFERGLSIFGKLRPKRVVGGIVIEEIAFTLT